MAGTLTISTLSDGTNSTSSTNCIQGSAKAWVNFNGTTSPGTIRASYNVGSVTKNGTGDYTVNFTNAMSDANYSMVSMADKGAQTDAIRSCNFIATTQVPLAGSCRIGIAYATNTAIDSPYVCVSIFR